MATLLHILTSRGYIIATILCSCLFHSETKTTISHVMWFLNGLHPNLISRMDADGSRGLLVLGWTNF